MSENVLSYIDDHAERSVEDLKRLCRQPSLSAQNLGVGDCANLLQDMMKESGPESRILPMEGAYPGLRSETCLILDELKFK